MLTTAFAFLVTIICLLSFKTTRWMGAVGVFILLSVAPVISSLLLISVAVACYFLFGSPSWDEIRKKLPWRD